MSRKDILGSDSPPPQIIMLNPPLPPLNIKWSQPNYLIHVYLQELFQPKELQAMVVGNDNYDWDQLEQV